MARNLNDPEDLYQPPAPVAAQGVRPGAGYAVPQEAPEPRFRPASVDENGVPTYNNLSIPQTQVTTPANSTDRFREAQARINGRGYAGEFEPDQRTRTYVTSREGSSGPGRRTQSGRVTYGTTTDDGLTSGERVRAEESQREYRERAERAAFIAEREDMQRAAAERKQYLTDRAAYEQAKRGKEVLGYEMAQTDVYPGRMYDPNETMINNPLFTAGERDAPFNEVYRGYDSAWDRDEAAMSLPGDPRGSISDRERLGHVFSNAEKYPSPQAQYERIMQGPGADASPDIRAIWTDQGAKLQARIDEGAAPYLDAVESFFIDNRGKDAPPVTEEQRAAIRQRALSGINEQTVGDIFNPKISPFNYAANLAIRQGLGDGSIRPATPFFDPRPEELDMSGNWMVVDDYATDRGRGDIKFDPAELRAGNAVGNFLSNTLGWDWGLADDKVAIANSANPGQIIMVPRTSFPTGGLPQVKYARLREVVNGGQFRDDEITIPDRGQRALSSAISSGQGVSSTPDAPLTPPVMPEQAPATIPEAVESPPNLERQLNQEVPLPAPDSAPAPAPPVQPVAQAAPAAADEQFAARQFASIDEPWEAPVTSWRASDDGSVTEQGMAQQARIAQAMKQAYQEGDMEWLARLQSIYSPDQWTAQV